MAMNAVRAYLKMAMNAVRAYFNRNWRREDMMSSATISRHAHTALMRVYLTLFCAMSAAAFGSHLHLIWEAGGLFTVLCSEASLLWLYFTPPWKVRNRFVLMMVAAFCFGASVGPFTKYFFEIDQRVVSSFLTGAGFSIGVFMFAATMTRERSKIYKGCLVYACFIRFLSFVINESDILDGHIAHPILKVTTMLILFIGYLVLYSQEILYDAHARFRYIDAVDRTLTIFFHLPAIVVHAARLYLRVNRRRRRRINRRHSQVY